MEAEEIDVEIHIIAHKLGWDYEYKNENISISSVENRQIVLPVNVNLDAIPGFIMKKLIVIESHGVYSGKCEEHKTDVQYKSISLKSVSVEEYNQWIDRLHRKAP